MTYTTILSWITDNSFLTAALAAVALAAVFCILHALIRVVPRHIVLLLFLNLVVHFLTYLLPRILPIAYTYHDLTSALDRMTPFFSPMVVIYLGAYFQWAQYWILLSREEKTLRGTLLAGEWISKFICMAVFILYPTTLVRPSITGTGIFDRLTALVYLADEPNNLLPSVHCLMSWFCIRGAFRFKNAPDWYKPVTVIFSVLVFLSTIMVRQHVWIDVPTAILAAEIGIFLARKTGLNNAFAKWEESLVRKA